MYAISNNYKNEVEQKSSVKSKSKIVVDNIEYTSIIKTTPKISHKSTSMIGGFPIKTCSFEIYDIDGNLDFKDKEVTVYKGIETNGVVEYIQQGIFIPRAQQITTNISQKTITFNNIQDKGQFFTDTYKSELDWNFTHTGLEIVQEICTNLGVELETTSFNWYDYDFKQPNFNETTTYREVISRIAEIGGSIAFIGRDGKLVIKKQYATDHIINNNRYVKLSKEEQYGPINVVVLGKKDINDDIAYPLVKPSNIIEWKILDNPFVDLYREEMIEKVANYIIGQSIIPFELSDFVDGFFYDLNDVIKVKDKKGDTFDAVLLNYETTSRIRSIVGADVQEKSNTNYNLAGSSKVDIKKVSYEVDHVKNQILNIVETNDEFSRDISQLKLEQSSISASVNKIVNTVRTITGMHKLTLPNAMAGNMLELSIKGNISLLFLKFYLGSNTFFKNSNLVIKCGENIRKIKLPLTYLDYLNSDVFDEFTIDRNGICKKITRIGTDEQGNKVALSNEKIEEVGKIFIQLFEGDNEIYLESFANDDVTYTASYATKNELTDVFTTSVDAKASFELQDEKMDLKLEKKTDNDKLIAQINLSTEKNEDGSLIQIESDKLNIKNKKFNLLSDEIEITSPNFSVNKDGRIVATSGEIGGFSLLSNTFSVCIKDKYDYDQTDIVRMNEIKNGSTATEEEMAKYDINENGNVDTDDIFEVLRKINGYANTAGEFVLSSDDPKFIIKTTGNGSQTRFTKIGLSEIETYKIYATTASFESLTDSTSKTDISGGNITCASLTQTSLEKNKKNFEIFKSGIEEVMKTDIYKYNLKSEQDNKKKHLGFVIGKKYNYSKLITVIDDDGNEIGVDNYSMTSLCLQAIKEQQLIIQNLENRIKRLEEISNGTNSKEGI